MLNVKSCLRKCNTRTLVVSLALLPEQHAPHPDQPVEVLGPAEVLARMRACSP